MTVFGGKPVGRLTVMTLFDYCHDCHDCHDCRDCVQFLISDGNVTAKLKTRIDD